VVTLKNHPTDESLGSRQVAVGDTVYISGADSSALKDGEEIRLIELCNIRVSKMAQDSIGAELSSNEIKQSMKKIQWVAKNDIVDYKILIPKELYIGEQFNTNSLEVAEGFTESYASKLKPDTPVQFVRFGFCRIDGPGLAILAHR
jgi:glutamyl-tRNA synthetase